MPYFDTLEYVDAGGSMHEIALNLNNLATVGGAVKMEFLPKTHTYGQLLLTWDQPPETSIAIPFKSRCKVRIGRSSASGGDSSFSGGSILFQGRRTDNEGSASASRVMTTVTLSDALWDLSKITFQIVWKYISGGTTASPTYSNFNWPDIVLFQPVPGATYSPAPVVNTITTWQQILDIINYAIGFASGADAVQLQVSSTAEFTPVYCNWYPVRASKCLECLTFCLRPHPGVFTSIDHTTSTPTIHFRNRANMTSTTLPYKSTDVNGIIHIASEVQPLDQLVPDAVRIYYKITGTFDGYPVTNFATDIYPPGAANSLLCQDFSIDITGASLQKTIVNFTSAAFDPTSLALWRKKIPALRQISDGGQLPNDGDPGALTFLSTAAFDAGTNPKGIQVLDESGAPINYSAGNFEFVTDDNVYSWFNLGSASAQAVKATVKAFFGYDKKSIHADQVLTDTMQEHEHHFRVLLTNAPSDVYELTSVTAGGEVIPSNLAQRIFTELGGDTGSGKKPQWKLRHEIIQTAVDGNSLPLMILPGKHKINLSGGDAAWTTIEALPENVRIQLFRVLVNKNDGSGQSEWRLTAQQSISCGPVNHLEPGYLVQLCNLFWNRNRSGINAYDRLTGVSNQQVDLSANAARENSTAAEPVPVVTNHVYLSGGTVAGRMNNSAKEIANILGATTPKPVSGAGAHDHTIMQPRECLMCDAAGNQFYAIVHMTGGYTKPA